jgi:hypothetical protein
MEERNMVEKECHMCKQKKQEEEFVKGRNYCKKCASEYNKKRRAIRVQQPKKEPQSVPQPEPEPKPVQTSEPPKEDAPES